MTTGLERQLELESEMVGLGAKRYWDNVYKAREKEEESNTAYGVQIIKKLLAPLSQKVTEFVEEAYSGVAGPKNTAAKYLRDMDADTAAYLILKEAMNGVTTKRPVQVVAIGIASAIEDEARFTKFATEAKREWKWASETVQKQTGSHAHQRRVLITMMARAAEENRELVWEPWEERTKLRIGVKAIDLLIAATGVFRYVVMKTQKNNSETLLQATQELLDIIQDRSEFCEVLQPVYLPTIIPPKRWTNPFNGGYHSTIVRRIALVKTNNKNYLEELANTARDMPLVYSAVNYVQGTAWAVNTKILEVMQQVWDSGIEVSGFPARTDIPLPPKPNNIATDKIVRREWKRAASKIYGKNAQTASKRLQAAKIMYLGDKFKNEKAIYFPMQLDFRGRMYAVPSYLNPQGCDAAKGLLQFAEGKPVDETAMRWLKIHGANTYGEDKCSMDNRVKWVEDNHDSILQAGRDPLGFSSFWCDADKPWQFLAFCMEYVEVVEKPGYCSRLPVSVDGACNGLQHFSAMLRDAVGGAAVNLLPTDIPADIYAAVAKVAARKVAADATGETVPVGLVGTTRFTAEVMTRCGKGGYIPKRRLSKADQTARMNRIAEYEATLTFDRDTADKQFIDSRVQYAKDWLDHGITRKVTKRSVMVLPYGGTLYSSRQFVEDYIQEAGLEWEDSFKRASYLAKHIWSSIGDVVIAARQAMEWLQTAAKAACDEGIPIAWKTPVGFPVMQAYPELKSHRVDTKIAGSIVKLSLVEENFKKLDRRRQCNGISPNFVHSMDACCLMLSTNRAADEGIVNFAMVHDSYGTLAADMERMSVCLRDAFVDMYQSDVLADFNSHIQAGLSEKNKTTVPPLPEKGSLNIEAVKDSVYFFA